MKNEKTTWSSPKTNIFAAINDLRKALSSGHNAVLVKEYNEACNHPIKYKKHQQDFRTYTFFNGYQSTKKEILADTNTSEFQKYLSLNYKACYGTQEAVDTYYNSGKLTKDNIKGMGRCHLVKVTDLIKLLKELGEVDIVLNMFYDQYIWSAKDADDRKNFYDFFTTDHQNVWGIKKFKSKLWVVELHDKKTKLNLPITQKVLIKIFNTCLHPLKYIPRKSTLKMPEYTNHTFRIGGVTNGFSVEFQIPKKFSLK